MVPHFRNSVPQVLLDSPLPGDIAPIESHRAAWLAGELPCPTSGDAPENSSSSASSIQDILNPPFPTESQTTTLSNPPPATKDDLQIGQLRTSVPTQGVADAKCQREEENDATSCARDTKSSPVGVKRSHDEMIEKMTNAGNDSVGPSPLLILSCFTCQVVHVTRWICQDQNE